MLELLAGYQENKKTHTSNPSAIKSPSTGPMRPLKADDVNGLPLDDGIKELIINGGLGNSPSRSERDQKVIIALLRIGIDNDYIFNVFDTFPIGEKYREHPDGYAYLESSIDSGKAFIEQSEKERRINLKLTDCIFKDDSGNFYLDIFTFQQYVTIRKFIKINDGSLHYYNNRYYKILSEDQLNLVCQNALGGFHRKLFTASHLSKLKHYIMGDIAARFNNAGDDPINYLNLENGLYDLALHKLIDHTPEIFTITPLPFKYQADVTCPLFIKFLNEIFLNDQDQINFIQEAIGYCFHQEIPEPAIFYFVGEGANGKSVLLNTISKMLGPDNTTHISLSQLSDQFTIINLYSKLANIITETPRLRLVSSDLIKAIVAGDWVLARHPHERAIQFRPYAKHFFAMNEVPAIEDISHGMWRRIHIVHFPRVFEEQDQDKGLEKKLEKELSGIFNWALKGLERLKSNDFIFTKVMTMEDVKKQIKRDSNGVLLFADEFLVTECPLPLKTAYDQYRIFCAEEGLRPENKVSFKKVLIANGYVTENNTRDGNKVYIFYKQNDIAA